MALVSFTPDPTQAPGTGWFTNDQGRTLYTTDLQGAKSVPPTPAPPSADDNEPAAPPGTTVSYAGDQSSPYANAVASNEGAAGSAAVGASPSDLVAKVGQVVAPAAAPSSGPAALVAKAAQVVQPAAPITKTSTTIVNGRSKAGVEKQIGTDQAALGTYGDTLKADASNADTRAQSSLDAQVAGKTALQTQAKEDQLQAQTDQRSADALVQQYTDLPDGQLDPDRFVNSLSTGSKIGMAVLAAVSGFASGLRNAGSANSQGGAPDLSVLQVLNRRIDQDIEAQKDQLAQGRIRKNNLIARAMAKGADARQAEATARGQLWGLASDIGTLQAQKLGLQGAQLDAAKNALAGMQYQASQHYGDLRAQTEARVQTTNERETGKPVAGGEAQTKAWENYGKAIDAGADPATAYGQSGLAALGISQPIGQTKEQRAEAAKAGERSEDQGAVSEVMTASSQLAHARGFVRDSDGAWAPGGRPGSAAQLEAAKDAYTAALKKAGHNVSLPTPGIGSKLLDALPFGFLLSNDEGSAEDTAAQLNATESTLRPRLNPKDRGTPNATVPRSWK